MPLITRLIALAVSTAVTALVTKAVTKFLEDKSMEDLTTDGKTKIINMQISALEKTIDRAQRMKDKLQPYGQK